MRPRRAHFPSRLSGRPPSPPHPGRSDRPVAPRMRRRKCDRRDRLERRSMGARLSREEGPNTSLSSFAGEVPGPDPRCEATKLAPIERRRGERRRKRSNADSTAAPNPVANHTTDGSPPRTQSETGARAASPATLRWTGKSAFAFQPSHAFPRNFVAEKGVGPGYDQHTVAARGPIPTARRNRPGTASSCMLTRLYRYQFTRGGKPSPPEAPCLHSPSSTPSWPSRASPP